ncbi:rhomboid family intramembrane serine protease [Candidatus Woesearchaeota archaeon]|nr:rhomboid family intramembrane serine protease [Candidatus Woesearchaeota archaeon]
MRYITLWLAGIAAIVFIAQTVVGTSFFVLDSSLVWHQPWRLVTAIFAHGSIGHLLSNLVALVIFGLVLEQRIGPKRFFWLFMISGIAINMVSPFFYERSLGASGAIYAILGTLAVLRPMIMVWAAGVPMPMAIAGLFWLAQDVAGVFIPDNVANIAHISGLGMGLAAGIAWRKKFGDKKPGQEKNPLAEKELDEWEKEYMH